MKDFREMIRVSLLLFLMVLKGAFTFGSTITQKMDNYDVVHYSFDLSVSNLSGDIEGSVTILIRLKMDHPDSLFFELSDSAGIDSILLNGYSV